MKDQTMADHGYTLNIVSDAVSIDRRIDADDYVVRVNSDGVSSVFFFTGEAMFDDTTVAQARV